MTESVRAPVLDDLARGLASASDQLTVGVALVEAGSEQVLFANRYSLELWRLAAGAETTASQPLSTGLSASRMPSRPNASVMSASVLASPTPSLDVRSIESSAPQYPGRGSAKPPSPRPQAVPVAQMRRRPTVRP